MRGKKDQKVARHRRLRKKISGTENTPRLCVFRSNKHIYAQIIDDSKMKTIISASDLNLQKAKAQENTKTLKIEKSYQVGINLAKQAIAKKVKKVVFDRGGHKYHGRIKSLAEGARKGGLVF